MRNIPENNLAYPVLISLASGNLGSGFQLNTGEKIYIVTAKHVLFNEKNILLSNLGKISCQTSSIEDDTTTDFNIDFNILNQSANIFYHKDKDVASFTIGNLESGQNEKKYKLNLISGVTIVNKGDSGTVSVAKANVLPLSGVLVSNDVFLYGYPSSLGLKQTPQFEYSKPLLRKGIVASINKKQGTIILDCPVYYGNSGGPVVQVSVVGGKTKHNVIGVVSQFIPYAENWVNQSNKIVHTEISNSGYSVAVAMDYVYEMLSIK